MEDERLWGFFADKCNGFLDAFLTGGNDWPLSDEVEECAELDRILISELIKLYELVDCPKSRVRSCFLLTSGCLSIRVANATALDSYREEA
jgi:hypothetical protein